MLENVEIKLKNFNIIESNENWSNYEDIIVVKINQLVKYLLNKILFLNKKKI